jgi:SAM-dependent methyltransferase
MGRKSFENYGLLVSRVRDFTALAGRYSVQKSAERIILRDVLAKLDIRPEHSLLDIGCNAGNLTIPLSFMVARTTGLDHPECLRRMRERFPTGIELVSGNFLDVALSGPFDRILCYDVLHYLRNPDEVYKFMDKAVGLLAQGGKALFGDIPNVSVKQRFLESAEGIDFSKKWQDQRKHASEEDQSFVFEPDPELVQFDDRLMLDIIRKYRRTGSQGYILPQAADLPFGHTREDILIVRLS